MGPESIGKYRVESALGAGSFATVWLAYDELLDARVAIKVLADNWARQPDIRRRFIDEAKLLRRIDHDSVVSVHVVDELPDGRPYFVMSWADKGTLYDRMRDRRAAGTGFTPTEALSLTIEIADSLAVVHAFGIVHRDIKPSNVLFRTRPEHHRILAQRRGDPNPGDQLLVGDFGLAKDLTGGSGFSFAAGTPAYMAPEQADPDALVDARADVFSTTAILYELVSGRAAFSAETLSGVNRGRGSAASPHRLAPGTIPAGIQEIIDAGLTADPAQRISSAYELADALRDVLAGRPVNLEVGLRSQASGTEVGLSAPPPLAQPSSVHPAGLVPAAPPPPPVLSPIVRQLLDVAADVEQNTSTTESREVAARARRRLLDRPRVGVTGLTGYTSALTWALAGERLSPLTIAKPSLHVTWLATGAHDEGIATLHNGSQAPVELRRDPSNGIVVDAAAPNDDIATMHLTITTPRLRTRTVLELAGPPRPDTIGEVDVLVVVLPAEVDLGLDLLRSIRSTFKESPTPPARVIGLISGTASDAAARYRLEPDATAVLAHVVETEGADLSNLERSISTVAQDVDALRVTAALAALSSTLLRKVDPASRRARAALAEVADAVALEYSGIEEITILRQEVGGAVTLPASYRDELRRVLGGGDAATRLGLPPGTSAPELRASAQEALTRWRTYVNTGRVPFASRDGAQAVVRVLERLWTSSQPSMPANP